MRSKAARLRENRRHGGYASTDRKVVFRLQGCHYVVFRNDKDVYSVVVNGRLMGNPPKSVLKMARREMALEDVDAVHAL